MLKKFDIILTVYNRLEYTKRTVASLISSGAFEACERFIIVDNHSTEEGMEQFLSEMAKYKNTFIVRRPQNDGWGVAVNDCLGLSRAEYVFISNNDVEYQSEFYKQMFQTFDAMPNQIGILGVWRHNAHGFVKNGIMNEVFREMDNVPAVGWMIPKFALEKVGMFKENGPCLTKGGNGEDTDMVGRMKEAGLLVGVPPVDVATHIDGY